MLEPGALGPLLWAGKWRYQAWETSFRRAALPASGLREALGCSRAVHRTVPHRGRGSPALTKASGSGPVYMMHSSQEHQAPGRLPCSSSRKEGGGPQGQTGDTEELEAAVPPGSHSSHMMGPHWVPSSSSGVQDPAAHPAGPSALMLPVEGWPLLPTRLLGPPAQGRQHLYATAPSFLPYQRLVAP